MQGITVEHKGFILKQGSHSTHYMIFDANTRKMVMHCSCKKRLTEDEAKEHIDLFIEVRKELK